MCIDDIEYLEAFERYEAQREHWDEYGYPDDPPESVSERLDARGCVVVERAFSEEFREIAEPRRAQRVEALGAGVDADDELHEILTACAVLETLSAEAEERLQDYLNSGAQEAGSV